MQMIRKNSQYKVSSDPQMHLANLLLVLLAATGWWSEAQAASAVAERSVLVDAAGSGLNPAEISRMIDRGLAISTSGQVLNAVQSGVYERIIASTELSSGAPSHVAGIPWMVLGNSSQVAIFPRLTRDLTKPDTSTVPKTSPADNDSELALSIIEVVASDSNFHHIAAAASISGAATTTSGFNLITKVTQGSLSSLIDGFYSVSVLNIRADGLVPTLSLVDPKSALPLAAGLHSPLPMKK